MPSKQSRKNRKKTTGRRPSRSMQSKKVEPKETTRFTEMSKEEPETPIVNTDPLPLRSCSLFSSTLGFSELKVFLIFATFLNVPLIKP